MQYIWLVWSLALIAIWLVIYALLDTQERKREMLVVSGWTALLGVTEPFFVPLYWAPPSLFDLALRTGFDIESFLFSFGIGGIAVVLYGMFFKNHCVPVSAAERHRSRHRYHWWAIVSAPVIFAVLFFATALNPIYSAIIAMAIGGVAAWRCRPDLKKKMATSALLFLGLYFVYFQMLIVLSPGYVEQVWNMEALSGVLIAGIPLEELLFAASFGFLWSSIYEHIAWKKLS